MPVKIRLRRLGTKKKPSYRIVAVDSRVSTRGKVLELLGHYAPIENPAKVDVDIEKVDIWIKKGAQLSDTVSSILRKVKKSQEQEKTQKDTETQKKEQKGVEKKTTQKTTPVTKVAQSKKGSKNKQAPKKSKKKLSRAR